MDGLGSKEYWERLFISKLPLPKKEIKGWIQNYAAPYKELMAYYKCAMMEVEVQFRTISMDWWASLEHKIRYKKDVKVSKEITEELRECAETAAILDNRMETIQKRISNNKR